ncbi:hypothetical protein KUV85_17030 [Nocardioides panacisoli]|uniref:hypothetical protein n=1 Tax=Nocardioides panacisoli TaxID=627624 RepID=UPI001C632FBA|nr:hypothetical protein [Nocardioides panacisoli]QYJ04004.1 hypothetical protein KUV85_17030 [Nocardioides panacisoli]
MKYDVVLLVEQALVANDAQLVASLHEDLDDEVVYHVLMPMTDAAASVEASLGALGGADLLATPVTPSPDELAELRREYQEAADHDLAATVTALEGAGGSVASKAVITEHPVDALVDKVQEADCREVIILTRPHLVAEFFHVDWSSRARRKLDVPVLHLLEHEQDEVPDEG